MVTLEDVCESVRYGYTASASPEPCGPRFLRITDIVGDSIDWTTVPYCQIDDTDKARFALQPGDIVVARTGATVGYAKLIREPVDSVFASYLVRFRVDQAKAVPAYIGKLVESKAYKAFVRSRIGGAAQPNASAPVLGAFSFSLPSSEEQARVAGVLSAFDNLIENNRRRINLLEQSTRLLYREWFVRLRFPGHEHVRVIDGVPEGWAKKPVVDLAEINARSLPSKHEGYIEYVDIASVTTGVVNDTTAYNFADAPGRARRIVRHGDMIWSCVRPNRASYAAIWRPKPNLIVSTGFCVLSPTSVPPTYLYHALSTQDFVGHLTNNAKGAAYPAVVSSDFASYQVLVPGADSGLLEEFQGATEPAFELMELLKQQNHRLREARDLLLPRMMSGALEV